MLMVKDFVFLYIVWGSSEKFSNTTAAELSVSIMSVKKHMPKAKIAVYVDRKSLGFLIPFLELYADYILDTRCDINQRVLEKKALIPKVLTFRKAIDDFDNFLYLDSDTIINLDISGTIPDCSFALTAHNPRCLVQTATRREYLFFNSVFNVNYRRFANSALIRVHRSLTPKLWNNLRKSFRQVSKTALRIATLEYQSECSRKFTDADGLLSERFMNDEHYFATILFLNKKHPKNFLIPTKFYNMQNFRHIRHAKGTFVDEDGDEIQRAKKAWEEAGVDMSHFNYPRLNA
jgi:hypothetical protein